MPLSSKPAILVATSTVVRGSVGGRAAVFALERLGFPVWSIQTVTLPWHPGQGRASRVIPDEAAFATLIDDLVASPRLGEIGGILTGYLGAASQAAALVRLIDAVKAARPDALYLCDPVMGDNGALYVPQATAEAIRDQLAPRADILTPNRTELAFLTGRSLEQREALIEAARALHRPTIAVTSAASEADATETLLISDQALVAAHHARIEGAVPKGAGDLFAALLLGRLLGGNSDREALRLATGGVLAALEAAQRLGTDELPLAAMQDELVTPRGTVTIHG
ncbi:pyridoxal kinase [Kaistia algarum]|uniref:pyridoxal kinase n=1 Tax=Kaistia algarum TaxID=2083279 RepID=UPI000CE89604|nr:pyridoxal kinase [Kaistia algarum]MCX5514226.1 pyridoxal kinase [Kaistia algarum]PPE77209.1 pyridoxal kinase [Kaistia algarum]